MSKPMLFLAKALMAAAITVFATAQTSEAQRRGGGGGGWHGGGGGGWHGGWHGNNNGNFWGGVGVGLGVGYLTSGYGWGGYYGGGYPYYGGWGGYPSYSTGYYYPNNYTGYSSPDYYDTSSYSYYPPMQQPSNNTAMIQVFVPPDATVSFDGSPTSQRGPSRLFTTPPLTPGSTYTYNIQASWMANGQPVTQTRQVQVQAGRESTVNFNVAGS